MLRYLIYLLRIRRIEFRLAEIPILLLPVFLLARDATLFQTTIFWEGILVCFFLFAFGDMINCLADRDLDAIYKPHLSEAVYGLGVRVVAWQIGLSALAAVLLAAHLSYQLNRWWLLVLVIIGLLLGAAYSVKPVQLKGRGLAQLACLWLIIFIGPMAFIAALLNVVPTLAVIVFAAAYGTLQMGVILVNTAEDYPEDLAAGICTTIVALGLQRGIALAAWLALLGSLGVLASLFWLAHGPLLVWLALLLTAAACVYATVSIRRLARRIAGNDLELSIQTVKQAAKKVPLWITAVAWSTLLATFVIFYLR